MIQRKNGYSLVLIILMSTFILALLAGAMRVVTQSYIYSQEEYYYKLAQEAGEAGTAYANACLDANGAEQSWSSAPGGIGPLHPETNCKGAVTFPGNRYVFENSKLRTTFEVGDLEASTKGASSGVALSAATAQISSTGRVEITNGSGTVLKTYTAVVKKSVTWPADIDATRIVSGTNRTCAILSNNVWCWGSNDKGQLGDGTTNNSNIPVKVRSIGDMKNGEIIDIFTAQHHSCVLTKSSTGRRIYCWGDNRSGQLGNSDFGGSYSAVPIEIKVVSPAAISDFSGDKISAIGGTGDTSCAIASGKVYCWGGNDRGQLGYGSPGNPKFSATPARINSGGFDRLSNNYSATKLSTGGSRSRTMCVITTEKRAYCWGQAKFGQLGVGPIAGDNYSRATRVKELENVIDISQDGYWWEKDPNYVTHACAVAKANIDIVHGVYCWGGAGLGQSGSPGSWSGNPNDPKKHLQPVKVHGLPGEALQVEVGISHSCALMNNNTKKEVYCWGNNEMGQLGANRKYDDSPDGTRWTYEPMQVKDGLPAGKKIVSLSAGANRGCVIMENKRSYCWGLNNNGQIGDGTNEDRNSPTESLFLRPVQNRYIY